MYRTLIHSGPFCNDINCKNCRPDGFNCNGVWLGTDRKQITDINEIDHLNELVGVRPCRNVACNVCYGTGYYKGWGAPCIRGCKKKNA